MSERTQEDLQAVFNALILAIMQKGGSNRMASMIKILDMLRLQGYTFEAQELSGLLNELIQMKLIRYTTFSGNDTRYYGVTKVGLMKWTETQKKIAM